jgi:hypothetical protein
MLKTKSNTNKSLLMYLDIYYKSRLENLNINDCSTKIQNIDNLISNIGNSTRLNYYIGKFGIKNGTPIYDSGVQVGIGQHQTNSYNDKYAFIIDNDSLFGGVNLELITSNGVVYTIGTAYTESINNENIILNITTSTDILPDINLLKNAKINGYGIQTLYIKSYESTTVVPAEGFVTFNKSINNESIECYDLGSSSNTILVGLLENIDIVENVSYFTTSLNNISIISSINMSNNELEINSLIGVKPKLNHIDVYIPISEELEDEIALTIFMAGYYKGMMYKLDGIEDYNIKNALSSLNTEYLSFFNDLYTMYKLGMMDAINEKFSHEVETMVKNEYTNSIYENEPLLENSRNSLLSLSFYDKVIKNIKFESSSKNVYPNNESLSLTNITMHLSDFNEVITHYGFSTSQYNHFYYNLDRLIDIHHSDSSILYKLLSRETINIMKCLGNTNIDVVLGISTNNNIKVEDMYKVLYNTIEYIKYNFGVNENMLILFFNKYFSVKKLNTRYVDIENELNYMKENMPHFMQKTLDYFCIDSLDENGIIRTGYNRIFTDNNLFNSIDTNFIYEQFVNINGLASDEYSGLIDDNVLKSDIIQTDTVNGVYESYVDSIINNIKRSR